uniref:Uncharacterized protein n=1 Tax=Cacopsylla melanoneura TaxID=428564 RepID=A0A8D8TT59_9HEMI
MSSNLSFSSSLSLMLRFNSSSINLFFFSCFSICESSFSSCFKSSSRCLFRSRNLFLSISFFICSSANILLFLSSISFLSNASNLSCSSILRLIISLIFFCSFCNCLCFSKSSSTIF